MRGSLPPGGAHDARACDASDAAGGRQTHHVRLADAPIEGVICGADEDWFALGDVEAGCQVDVGVLYATRDGDLDVSIHAADGAALATADGADQGGPVARLRTEGAAPLYARVVEAEGLGAVPYLVAATIDCAPPPVCEDDIFEENDAADAATDIEVGEALEGAICAGDDDWFAFDVPEACTVDVRVTFTHADGDLDMVLTDAVGAEQGSSDSEDDDERITERLPAGRYAVRVYGFEGAENTYGLQVDLDCGPVGECVDDDLEDDDQPVDATPLQPGTPVNATLCGGDDDYFTFTTPSPACEVTVTADFRHADGDLDLQLFDALGRPAGRSATPADQERIAVTLPAAGAYTVRAFLFGGQGSPDYTLTYDLACPPPLACPADDAFEPDDTVGDATPLEAGATYAGILCADDPDHFGLLLEAGCRVEARVDDAGAGATLRLVDANGAEVAPGVADATGSDLDATVEAAGAYALALTGDAGTVYALGARVTCPPRFECPGDDPLEENDAIATATPLEPGAHVEAALCDLADYYAVEAEFSCTVSAQISFLNANGDLQLRLQDAGGFNLDSSTTQADVERVSAVANLPGVATYYVKVEGFFSDTNSYGLDVDVVCPTGRLVINEVDVAGPAQFVEVFNAGDADQPLEGIALELVTAATGEVYGTYLLADAVDRMAPGLFLVVGDAAVPAGALTLALEAPLTAAPGDGARIVDGDGVVLDAVTLGGFVEGLTEGAAGAPADPGNAASIGRCANGDDTDDNAADFSANLEPTPGTGNLCRRVLACPADDPEEPNDRLEDAFALGGEAHDGITCGGDPDWFAVLPLPGCTFSANLAFTHADGDLTFVLRGPDGTEITRSATATDDETVSFEAPDLGPYYLVVESEDGGDATYVITTANDCPEEPPVEP